VELAIGPINKITQSPQSPLKFWLLTVAPVGDD
jgi:hypothetical protein